MQKKHFLWLLFVLIAAPSLELYGQTSDITLWLNQYRNSSGLKTLVRDDLLNITAQKYAKKIAKTGHFSHIDLEGQRVQARYLATGGTHALVGEILGIGPDAEKIRDGWLNSEKHLAVLMDKRWTHYGQGFFIINSKLIYVLLFSEQCTAKLSHYWNPSKEVWHLTGYWLLPDKGPVLYNGSKPVFPQSWDPATGKFSYQIQASALAAYVRLGYQKPEKAFYVTNIFYPLK